jgi:hypothetical protein
MWFLLAACATAPELPAVPLEAAVVGVSDQLRSTAELTDREQALTALAAARAAFESSVEPHLRAEQDPLAVAEAEYGFALVHRAISTGGDARGEVDRLIDRLHPTRLAHR